MQEHTGMPSSHTVQARHPAVATDSCSRQAKGAAQRLGESHARLDHQRAVGAVHAQDDASRRARPWRPAIFGALRRPRDEVNRLRAHRGID
jgi:hypothetical protein